MPKTKIKLAYLQKKLAIFSKVNTLLIKREITKIIVHTVTAKFCTFFVLVNFLNIFKTNITATLKNDISASAQININIISGLSKKLVSLLFIIIK